MRKVLISVEDELLTQIDALADARGISRSAYVSDLAKTDLAAQTAERKRRIKRALKGIDDLFAQNPTPGDLVELVREERRSH